MRKRINEVLGKDFFRLNFWLWRTMFAFEGVALGPWR